ncbi:serine/threonine-protein kinase, partial [bacterium]|nr:serine/threonine-protein kinase [bacterium]
DVNEPRPPHDAPEPRDPDATMADADAGATIGDPNRSFGPARDALAEGVMIGNYRVLRPIGEGGMGEVWEAEQLEPVRRRVAIKLIRAGMDSRQFVARFEAERQTLAVMDHPGIAKIFDAGTTDRGIPYFAMEYVPGTPLIEYCDEHGLDTAQRLSLFMRICDGVSHAHQKGVIHRDLKPGNVLVSTQDGEPVSKIIDFGVAKATDEKVTDQTMLTRAGALIGTLEYMSPEQLAGSDDIDTRADVYALGVMLYELLTGALPFDDETYSTGTLFEMCRVLREQDPGRPSDRISRLGDTADGAARSRSSDVRALSRRLRGDLDWITMRALEKERARRYDSPRDLAADIQRHLDSEPVLAGPPGARYRIRKFVARHRAAVIAASIILVALFVGMAGTTYGLLRARRAEVAVRKEAAKAGAVADFLHGMLSSAQPSEALGRDVTVREVLAAASGEVGGSATPEEKEVEAAVRNTIGATYESLGLFDEAEPHLQTALELREGLAHGDDPETAASLYALGRLRWEQSNYADAERLITRALEMARRLGGGDDELVLACLGDLAVVYQSQGDYVRSEPMMREALALSRLLPVEGSTRVADNLNNLAWVVHMQGRTPEAEGLFREALEENRKSLGDEHPNVLMGMLNLASILDYMGNGKDAESMYRDAGKGMETVLGPEHPTTLSAERSLAEFYLKAGRIEEARPILRDATAAAERTLGPDHALTITLIADEGWLHRAGDELEEAEASYREALARRMRSLGPENPHTIRSQWQLARILHDRGRFTEAEQVGREALPVARRVLPEGNENRRSTLLFLGLALTGEGRAAEAEPLLRECLTASEGALPAGSWELGHVRSALGGALAGSGRFAEAEPLLQAGYETMKVAADVPVLRLRNAAQRAVALHAS